MNREGKNCGWCGIPNPRTAHWRVGEKRFCSKAHRQEYLDSQNESEMFDPEARHPRNEELNGYRFPSSTTASGRSPRRR